MFLQQLELIFVDKELCAPSTPRRSSDGSDANHLLAGVIQVWDAVLRCIP